MTSQASEDAGWGCSPALPRTKVTGILSESSHQPAAFHPQAAKTKIPDVGLRALQEDGQIKQAAPGLQNGHAIKDPNSVPVGAQLGQFCSLHTLNSDALIPWRVFELRSNYPSKSTESMRSGL